MSDELREGNAALNGIRQKIDNWAKKDDRLFFDMSVKPQEQEHVEGDFWFDNDGKEWTIKNGIKQSISKTSDARIPWWCPKCGKMLKNKIDDKMWYLYKVCSDCVVKYETQLQLDGKYEIYEKKKVLANRISSIKYFIEQTESALKDLEENEDLKMAFADGRMEVWNLPDPEKMKKDIMEDLTGAKEALKKLEPEFDEVFKIYTEMGIKEISEV